MDDGESEAESDSCDRRQRSRSLNFEYQHVDINRFSVPAVHLVLENVAYKSFFQNGIPSSTTEKWDT